MFKKESTPKVQEEPGPAGPSPSMEKAKGNEKLDPHSQKAQENAKDKNDETSKPKDHQLNNQKSEMEVKGIQMAS